MSRVSAGIVFERNRFVMLFSVANVVRGYSYVFRPNAEPGITAPPREADDFLQCLTNGFTNTESHHIRRTTTLRGQTKPTLQAPPPPKPHQHLINTP